MPGLLIVACCLCIPYMLFSFPFSVCFVSQPLLLISVLLSPFFIFYFLLEYFSLLVVSWDLPTHAKL